MCNVFWGEVVSLYPTSLTQGDQCFPVRVYSLGKSCPYPQFFCRCFPSLSHTILSGGPRHTGVILVLNGVHLLASVHPTKAMQNIYLHKILNTKYADSWHLSKHITYIQSIGFLFLLCPSSNILKNYTSETESVSILI
jgi:hypothetical protein